MVYSRNHGWFSTWLLRELSFTENVLFNYKSDFYKFMFNVSIQGHFLTSLSWSL